MENDFDRMDGGIGEMTTDELIKALRDVAGECEDLKRIRLLDEAADRLEELDERVAIMMESMDNEWGNNYS